MRALPIAMTLTLALVALPALSAGDYSSFVELRIYPVTNQERFLDYFEEHYLESQEVLGMRIWGQFRDLESPHRFVWLRGYRTMEERLSGLRHFYTSPLWVETGPEAVSMLTERASHIHFLEPVEAGDGFAAHWSRPVLASEAPDKESRGVLAAYVFSADDGLPELVRTIRSTTLTRLSEHGGVPVGLFRSSDEANNFPILPFIEDERVLVLFVSFASRADSAAAGDLVGDLPLLEAFVLSPGERSRLRHRAER